MSAGYWNHSSFKFSRYQLYWKSYDLVDLQMCKGIADQWAEHETNK